MPILVKSLSDSNLLIQRGRLKLIIEETRPDPKELVDLLSLLGRREHLPEPELALFVLFSCVKTGLCVDDL